MSAAIIDPMARDLPNGLTWTRQGKVRTRSGVVIGSAYQPPLATLNQEDVNIQRGLLGSADTTLADVVNGLACVMVAAISVTLVLNSPAIAKWLQGVL